VLRSVTTGLFTAGPLLLALCAGCGGDDSDAAHTSTTQPPDGDCVDGSRRCQGDVLQLCTAGAFVDQLDCATAGDSCVASAGGASCQAAGGCSDGELRCSGSQLERCGGQQWTLESDCGVQGQQCEPAVAGVPAGCAAVGWQHVPITIEDPVVVGSSLNLPVDGVSYGYRAAGGSLVTAFGRDLNDPSRTYLWHLDQASGKHTKKSLSGQVFAAGDVLCAGEDWCQLIGFDAQNDQWLLVGPAAPSMMRIDSSWQSSLSAVSGTGPASALINHSHRFDWSARQLYLFGATGPSGFADSVHVLDLDDASWSVLATGLSQTDGNCLAVDSAAGTLYSVGGRETTDGGNSSQALGSFTTIDTTSGAASSAPLPAGLAPRRSMSCAFDPVRKRLYLLGGAEIGDNFNEALNSYHNDLWVFDVASNEWSELLADTPGGSLTPPDQYGDQRFDADPSAPNFGRNRGFMHYDASGDRLMVIGSVPRTTHHQLYQLPLASFD
jgi:hypothetical protein